ncbi:hypothetical protein LA080_016022 [Diaporthe eres]|uniref:Uncharacterized protein n=1 Tax=Diaporthe vaccinii TaxID=105482 RepID=A0ABR4E035_9PEZI|nr:hypothetical protein LA080_016022 [Diaporthe eres]
MASNLIIPVSSPASSHELAHFLSADGFGAGFVRHRDIWSNNDEFLDMVWTLTRAPRKDGSLMKLLYIRHTVIETEKVVECFDKRWKAKARCGGFPDDEFRVSAMTFGKARRLFADGKALCENMVILVDGTYVDTTDTEMAMGLMNQSINPASCVKILGLYNGGWDDQEAEEAVPLCSPLLREAGVQKLSVSFARAGTVGHGPQPTLVGHRGLIDAMVGCVNQGRHIAFFLPRGISMQCVTEIEESPEKIKNILLRTISLTGETSMTADFDDTVDMGQIFHSDSYLFGRYLDQSVRVCSLLVAVDPDAEFTTIPFKRVGLVVYSHMTEQGRKVVFNSAAGVLVYSSISGPLDHRQMVSQLQSCSGVGEGAKHVRLSDGRLANDLLAVDYSKEFAFELIRTWPGKRMADIPLNLGKRNKQLLRRTMRHLTVADMVAPYENGFRLTEGKGAEMAKLLPDAGNYGLSFELAGLVASIRQGVPLVRSKRLLIRLAVMSARLDEFLAELTPEYDGNSNVSWPWMEEARKHMAGPARGQMAMGRLWIALGIWDKLRNETEGFSNLPEGDYSSGDLEACATFEGIGQFRFRVAVEIWTHVLELEDRAGLPLLGSSDPEWEEPLTAGELHDVQFQLVLAFISNLAVWDLGTDRISLVSSGHAVTLAPTSLVVRPHMARLESRPKDAYLVLPDRIHAGGAKGDKLMAESVVCVEASLLGVVTMVLGESAVDWLKWP